MKRLNNRLGYTLIEMLIAVSIISFIGGVLFTIMSQGFNLWSRANTVRPGMSVRFAMEKMTNNLRNAVSYDSKALLGSKKSLQVVTVKKMAGAFGQIDTIQKIEYEFDLKRKSIIEKEFSYPDLLLQSKKNIKEAVLLENVKDWDLAYYTFDPETRIGGWRNNWLGECQPSAVKINIDYDEDRSKQMTTIIPMLSGTCS